MYYQNSFLLESEIRGKSFGTYKIGIEVVLGDESITYYSFYIEQDCYEPNLDREIK